VRPALTPRRVWIARVLALVADATQIALLPLFFSGATGVADAVVDVAVGAALVALVGWHVAFLPGFLVELIPVVDLAPTWTLAVLWATRHAGVSGRKTPAPRP
jgi:hypothetical protein